MSARSDTTGKVHLIFKTHLDVGFTDLARNVMDRYFHVYIPSAIQTAASLRRTDSGNKLVWTTGSWLIYEYLEHADTEGRKQMEHAIELGDVVWHGLPFTLHSELADPSLFRFGLQLSRILDKRFGKTTISGKMTDVPGHTRAIVPALAAAGIEFLHIGVNEGSSDPVVPPVFVWRDPSGAEVMVMYENSYGSTVRLPGLSDFLSFAHTMDNRGPQDVNEIGQIYEKLRTEFPNATVEASNLNAVAHALRAVRPSLPVITEEIGDTWIHGVGADPRKVSNFRELLRMRTEWIQKSPQAENLPEFLNFSRFLLMVPEHTWGLDDKTYLGDYEHYRQREFESVKDSPPFRKMEESWEEQRRYVADAVRALGSLPQRGYAEDRLKTLTPRRIDTDRFDRMKLSDLNVSNEFFQIAFDASSGTINLLEDRRTGIVIADSTHRLGQIFYQSYSHADYKRFLGQYIKGGFDWAPPDFSKPGLDRFGADGAQIRFTVHESWYAADRENQTVILKLGPEKVSQNVYGGPGEVVVVLNLPADSPKIQFDVLWFDKPASRLPQSIWMSFVPRTQEPDRSQEAPRWWLHKLGARIAADEVVSNGGRSLHAVQDYIELESPSRTFRITTLDAPLVAIGKPSLLDFTNLQPQADGGAHFNLYNNVWGTNFPSWFQGDARFRFTFSVGETSAR